MEKPNIIIKIRENKFKVLEKIDAPSQDADITPEMVEWFRVRTQQHIQRVQKYATLIAQKFPEFKDVVDTAQDHDRSKLEEPERLPYIFLTWQFAHPDKLFEGKIAEMMSEATAHHLRGNKHHPEYWAPDFKPRPRGKDKDGKNLRETPVDATAMPEISILEMCADWMSMSEELGGSPVEWAKGKIGTRWQFTPEQEALIYKILSAIWNKPVKESKMDDIDIDKALEGKSEEWIRTVKKFPEVLQREILDERPEGSEEDLSEIGAWKVGSQPTRFKVRDLLKGEETLEMLNHLAEEVRTEIEKRWGIKTQQRQVYDKNPLRHLENAEKPSSTAKPSVIVNGEVYFGVGRFISALLRGDEYLTAWDVHTNKPIKESMDEGTDARYMELAHRFQEGDKSAEPELRQVIEDAAHAAGYLVGPVVHYSDAVFNRFDPHKIGRVKTGMARRIGSMGRGFYFGNPDAKEAPWLPLRNYGKHRRLFYLRMDHPYFVHPREGDVSEFTGYKPLPDQYDGARMKNDMYYKDEYMVKTPEQIKSADPVTFNDRGDIIPLSKRFNSGSQDIRESEEKNCVRESLNSARKRYGKDADRLSKLDPTLTKKYLDFICRSVVDEKVEEKTVEEYIKIFDILAKKNQVEGKDILGYKSFAEIQKAVDPLRDKQTKTHQKKGQFKFDGNPDEYDVVYENDKFTVIRPKTQKASCYFGNGTQWCTAARSDNNRFNRYTDAGTTLYYFIPKQGGDENKYAIATNSGSMEGFNASDMATGARTILDYSRVPRSVIVDLPFDKKAWALRNGGVLNPHTGLWDFDRDIEIHVSQMPVPLGVVKGSFTCSNSNITSLEGAPESVGGDFNCSGNPLSSLKGAPKSVGGDFLCPSCELRTLEGAPESVGGNFLCMSNPLSSLKGAPKSVGEIFKCSFCKLASLEGAPESVGGDFNCSYCNLQSLKGAPESVDGNFFCFGNSDLASEEIQRYRESGAVKGEIKENHRIDYEADWNKLQESQITEISNAERRRAKQSVDKVYRDKYLVVIRPRSQDASCLYGRGTKWCTSSTKADNPFSRYVSDGKLTLYYLIPTVNTKRGKYAVAVKPDGQMEAWDSADRHFSSVSRALENLWGDVVEVTDDFNYNLDIDHVSSLLVPLAGKSESIQESRLVEASYSEKDIPDHFYRIFFFQNGSVSSEARIQQLLNHLIPRAGGIADSPNIKNFLRHDTVLTMPGQEVVGMNKLSRVMYSNPDYLITNRMKNLKRVINEADPDAERRPFSSILENLGRQISKSGGQNYSFALHTGHDVSSGFILKDVPVLRNMGDILKFIRSLNPFSEHSRDWEAYRQLQVFVKKNPEEAKALLSSIITGMVPKDYHGEGEWILKDHVLRIPRGTVIETTSDAFAEHRDAIGKLTAAGYTFPEPGESRK